MDSLRQHRGVRFSSFRGALLALWIGGSAVFTATDVPAQHDYTLNYYSCVNNCQLAQSASMNVLITGTTVSDLMAIGMTNSGGLYIDTDGDGEKDFGSWGLTESNSTDAAEFSTSPAVVGGILGHQAGAAGPGTGYMFGTQIWGRVVYARRGTSVDWTPAILWPEPWPEHSLSSRPEYHETIDPLAHFEVEVEDPEGESDPPYPDQRFDLQIRAAGLCFPCDTEWPDQAVAGLSGGINPISGNKNVSRPDISIGTPGLPLDLNWNYNSVSDDGWRHSYNITLEDDDISYVGGTNDYKVIRTSSGTVPFEYNGSSYEGPLGAPHNHTLELLTNDNYLATLDGQQTILFDTNGLATTIADVFSNEVAITYTNDATAGLVVSRVEHSNGLGLDFLYVSGRVDQVLSPSSNLWMQYAYDASNRLVTASRVINGNTNTTTYSYEYAVDGAGMNLVAMVDPAGYSNVTGYATNGSGDFVSRATGTSFGASGFLDVEVTYPKLTRCLEP